MTGLEGDVQTIVGLALMVLATWGRYAVYYLRSTAEVTDR